MNQKRIIEIVKKEKIGNIILKLILLVTCLVTFMLNLKEYRQVFTNNVVINNYSNLNSAITNKYKYVTINLSNAEETRFAFQNENQENAAKVYEINYGDYNLLLVLNKNTAITNVVKGELLKENTDIKTIKEKLVEDSNNQKQYINSYFSNMDYSDEEKVTKTKFLITTVIILTLVFLIFIDFLKFLNPKKTHSYRKYIRKLSR